MAAASRLTVRKRSGTVTNYKKQKIHQAVLFCLINSCNRPNDGETHDLAAEVADRVERILHQAEGPITVEQIQDTVETVLMLMGQHQAARQYVVYREEHRKLREAAMVDPVIEQAIREDMAFFGSDAQAFQHYDKYARFNDTAGRRETYTETVDRVIEFMRYEVEERHGRKNVITEQEWGKMRRFILEAKATPAMRLMQTAGPAAKRCNMGVFNCAFAGITDLDYIHEGLYISMQGTGFAFSVENELIEQLPQIQFQLADYTPKTYSIEDSTEGWCYSVRDLTRALYAGQDLVMNYSRLRPAGARLKTKGGTASGSKPLMELHQAMRRIILARQGRRLRDIDVHDIMCFVGRAGEMGGFRRAACLSLSDADSTDMRQAKASLPDGRGYYADPAKIHRGMANNTAAYWHKPDALTFLAEWVAIAQSRSGERGIFNRGALMTHQFSARRREMWADQRIYWGTNPCGEIILHPKGGTCNLSIGIVRPEDTEKTLTEKVEMAAIFGTIQSMMTTFSYVRPCWKENSEKERLLGVDMLGALDCPLLRVENDDREALLQRLRAVVLKTNQLWAARLGINASTATTCIKPGGNSGFRFGTGQTMAGWLTEHMIRNVEVPKHSPMFAFLRDQNVPWENSYRDANTAIFSFLLKAPDGALVVSDLQIDASGQPTGIKPRRTAIDQLEDWLVFKQNWTEHNPSVSIYVADDEWLEVGHWVYNHWDDVGGLAFFPLDNGVYVQAPFTPVTKEKYDELAAKFPKIQWEKLPRYDGGVDRTEVHREKACAAKDGCAL